MRVYVAGPYTKGDVVINVRKAIEAADQLAALGHYPFIPHLSHFWHLVAPHKYLFWIEQDLAWLNKCDALLRLPGESKGADLEVATARKLGLKVYTSIVDIPRPKND
jgi:hypothetical protein